MSHKVILKPSQLYLLVAQPTACEVRKKSKEKRKPNVNKPWCWLDQKLSAAEHSTGCSASRNIRWHTDGILSDLKVISGCLSGRV